MILSDLADMPGFNPDGPQNGAYSVSLLAVYWGQPAPDNPRSLETVCCVLHGAMNCVAHTATGKIWRCLTCNTGAYHER